MIQQSRLPRLSLAILICCAIALLPKSAASQGIVSVNKLTGTANATIPIYNVSVGDLSAPVALSYSASGLKVEDYDNSLGMGWRLIADASITREVKGIPDDLEFQSTPVLKGWLRTTNPAPQTIQGLSFANTGATCDDEISNTTTIANNFPYYYDTEPDNFYISAPGLSCSFVFDANQGIKTIPYRDYQISYSTDSYGRITAFTVTNENGIKYYFDIANLSEHNISGTAYPGAPVPIDPNELEVFKRDFLIYNKKDNNTYPIKYNDKWVLSKMEDTRGNRITFAYGYSPYSNANPVIDQKQSYKEVMILKPDGNSNITPKILYGVTKQIGTYRLQSISTFSLGLEGGTFNTAVEFSWGGNSNSNEEPRLLSIGLPNERKSYELIYTKKFLGPQTVWLAFGRYFLKGLKATQDNEVCKSVNTQFDFTYYDVNEANNTCYCTPPLPGGTIIDTIVNAQDYWGYYNGKISNTNLNPQIWAYPNTASVELFKVYPIPGNNNGVIIPSASSDRSVTADAIKGSLKTITYPTGAVTELEYQNNEFFDKDVNGNVSGGGIRIWKITDNDGLDTKSITEYSYNDPSNTSLTTGRAVSVPKFTMVFQNSNNYGGNVTNQVINSTYRTSYDLNTESKEILYGKVTVRKTTSTGIGSGKSIYEYNTSGTFGSVPATDWSETTNFVARTNLSAPTPCNAITPGFLNNGYLQYPFASNANFDFERGLLKNVTHKNEAGGTVGYEEYGYARSHQNSTKVYGLKLDDIGNTMVAYGRYPVNTVVDNFLVTKTSKLYNSNSALPVTEIEEYEYTPNNSGLPYRLLKAIRKQNSNGITNISKMKYAKEYAATSTLGDDMNEALYNFNLNNQNAVIETTQAFSDGTEQITGGSFTTFKKVTIGDVINGGTTVQAFLPYKSYQFIDQAGILSTSFVPSTISANAFTWDAHYNANTPTTIEQYNTRGIPQVITGNSRIPQTILSTPLVNSVKVAEFSNAKPENIGFSNFDGEFTSNFLNGAGNLLEAGGRYSDYCLNFQPNTALCRVLTKQPASNNLIISFWLKDAQANGEIYLCTTKFGTTCSGTACTGNPIVSFTASNQWKYYQVTVPFPFPTILTPRAITLGTSTGVKIDDVLIYPDNAGVTTYSYTTNTIGTNLLTAKTGINGIGNSYEYDNAGRLWLVRDQFDNIVEMKKYKLANKHTLQIPSIEIGYNNQGYIKDVPGTFNVVLPYNYEFGDCEAPQISYRWNFGDGTEVITTGDPLQRGASSVQHTYTTIGNYLVTVTASSPGMTDVVAQTPPVTNVFPDPLPVRVLSTAQTCSVSGTPTVQICSAGIVQYTSAQQCILSNCFSLPSECNNTIFKISSLSGATYEHLLSVEWEKAPLGTSNWTVWQPANSGTAGFQTSHSFHVVHTSSYQMRAKLAFCNYPNSPLIVYSNTKTVVNGD